MLNMSKGLAWQAWILVMILALPAISCSGDSTSDQPPAQPKLPVNTIKVKKMSVPIYGEAVGNTQAKETVEIRSRVNGHMLDRFFEDGSVVRKDELLFQIDPDQYQQDLSKARAQHEYAKVSLDLARTETQRYDTLLKQAMISQEEFDLREVREQEAEANVQVTAASVKLAELQLKYTRITSPVDGRIGFALVDRGALVSAGSTLLAKISTVDPMHFLFYLSEEDYLDFSAHFGDDFEKAYRSMDVRLTMAGGKQYEHSGRLDMFDREVDPKTGSIAARAVFPNPDGMLRPGMFGRVRITLEKEWEMVLVPRAAIMETLGRQSVFVVDEQGAVSSRNVDVGMRIHNLRAVRGVKPGDMIAVDSLQKLRPGMTVAPTITSYELEETDSSTPVPASGQPADAGPEQDANNATTHQSADAAE